MMLIGWGVSMRGTSVFVPAPLDWPATAVTTMLDWSAPSAASGACARDGVTVMAVQRHSASFAAFIKSLLCK